MKKKVNIIFTVIFIILLSASCNNSNKSNNHTNNEDLNNNYEELQEFNPNDPTLVKFNGKMFSIPSPIQIALLSEDLNISFDISLLNPTSNYTQYTTSFKQSLNLGIYGADIGYLNIYDQLPEAAQYFAVIKTISKDLGVMNSFNQETIERIEANNNNKDSLVYILSNIYRDIDAYLLDNDRDIVGVLIIAGGWIESVYIMTQLYEKSQNQEIIERIGEQKTPLKNLIDLLKPFYGEENEIFDKFLEDLNDISQIFNKIDKEYIYKESITDEEKKLTIINSETHTNITDEQLASITEKINNLRTWIVE